MKLKSYFNPTRDANLVQSVQIRLAGDAAPAAPYVLLGALTHEPVDDNLSGAQLQSVSHAIYQHVQEQLFVQQHLQDMQKIKISYGGNFKPINRVLVSQEANRIGYNEQTTISVGLDPVDATNDGITFSVSNPGLVSITSNTGNGVFSFIGLSKGEFFVTVRTNGFEQVIPFEITEQLDAKILATSITLPAPAITLTVAAPTFQLVPTVLPANASNKAVTYSSSDPTKATVSATGLVTRVANGTTNITVSAKDGSGKTVVKLVTCTA